MKKRGVAPTRRVGIAGTGPVMRPPAPGAIVAPPRRRPSRAMGLVAAVAVLVLACVVAIVAIAKGGGSSGAASPESAASKFVASVDRGDLLGVLDMVRPSEREIWRSSLRDVIDGAGKAGLLPEGVAASHVEGFSADLSVRSSTVESLAADVAAVEVSGALASTLALGDYNPVGPDRRPARFRLAMVRDNGRWFVSLWYTVVENLRARSGRELAWPPRRGVVASPTSIVGSPDPISAVSEFVSAVEHLSVADLLASLDPVESDALQRTASWWLDGVQRSLDRLVERTNLEIRFTDPQYIATTKGTRSLVRLRGIQGGLRAGRFDVTIIENCASFSNPGQADTRQCFTGSLGDRDGALAELGRIGVPTPAVSAVRFYDDLRRAVTGVADNGIVARQIAGRWYVSLGGSITKLLLDIVSGGDRNAMQSMIDDARSLAGAVVDNAHSSGSATGPGATPGTAAPGDTATGTPDSVDNYGRYTECLASTDYDEARACISAGIAKGIINRAEVSGSFLYPECGWKGSRYDPTLAKLSNANYVSLATAASQCLEAKVAQGLLTALQVPFELVRVDCLKGVNPFRMSPPMTRAYLDCQLQGAPSAAG